MPSHLLARKPWLLKSNHKRKFSPHQVRMAGNGAVAPAAPGAGAGQQPQQGQAGGMLGMVVRMAFMWWLMSWFSGKGGGQNNMKNRDPATLTLPMFQKGEPVDMYVFLSESAQYSGGGLHPRFSDLIWQEKSIRLAEADPRNITYDYKPTPAVQHNASVWLHVYFTPAGAPLDPSAANYNEDRVFMRSYNMVKYMPRPKNDTGVNLLKGGIQPKKEEPEQKVEVVPWIGYMRPNMTIQVVDHFMAHTVGGVPPQIGDWMQYKDMSRNNYYPIIFFNDFWLLKDYLVPLNESTTNVTLHLDVGHISTTWWQMLQGLERNFEMQAGMGLSSEDEGDKLKRIFLEGNPILLAITTVVSLLHTVFDMLAFKNDIGFWKNNKSMEGLSARSVIINAFCQLVILLYLFDNETSYVVLFSSVLGTAIEFWKVTKAMDVSVDMGRFPYIHFKDRATYANNKTKQYDEEATRYLSYALYPLVIGYAIYSLIYETHKSWYSWILSSLVGAVYTFGFILMCPQLYLNYKLKSVAHLPWRQMTYKFLNTIIDDLFAFVIKMPLLHRLSVFRDDVIFLIYLYQRWIYRVDMKRVNEFGWAGEDGGAAEGGEEQQQAAGALPAGTEGTEKEGGRKKRQDAAAKPAVAEADSKQAAAGEASGPGGGGKKDE